MNLLRLYSYVSAVIELMGSFGGCSKITSTEAKKEGNKQRSNEIQYLIVIHTDIHHLGSYPFVYNNPTHS